MSRGGEIRAKRRFGQNFLRDQAVIADIIAAIGPQPGELLLEIGPGQGALTAPLLASGAEVTAIEIDRDMIEALERRFGALPNFHLLNTDALRVDLSTLAPPGGRLRVVGNLPYNISSPLLLHLLAYCPVITDLHVMLQREVALRLAAAPGCGDYGRLTIAAQWRCEVEILLDVAPECFQPAPSVVSSVVRLTPRATQPTADFMQRLGEVTQLAFSQRRKMVRQTLGKAFGGDLLAALGIPETARPEDIPVAAYAALAARRATP